MIHRPNRPDELFACNPQLLESLAQDQLDEERLSWLAKHLDHCDSCRRKLTEISFSGTDWNETRSVILAETARRADSECPAFQSVPSERRASLVRWLDPVADPPQSKAEFIGQVDGYLVKRAIGHGGMGVVLEAWDPKLHRAVAIKAMHPHLAANVAAKYRFVREARSAAAIVHPNVVAIFTVHAEHDPPYFVMPLIAGESLQARIERQGPLEVEACLRIAVQIADGLAAAHAQGLVHRDIKPANILFEQGTERALLTDFGVVRALNDATMTASGAIAGTPEYMSPEQATGRSIDTRSDLFSLGCVMYAMLVGRSPFRADSTCGVLRRVEKDTPRPLSESRPEIPESVESLVGWLLEKQREDRPESASLLADDLRQLLAHCLNRQQHALPPRLARRLQVAAGRNRPKWRTALLLGLVGASILFGLFAFARRPPPASGTAAPPAPTIQGAATLLDAELQRLDQWTTELEAQLRPAQFNAQ